MVASPSSSRATCAPSPSQLALIGTRVHFVSPSARNAVFKPPACTQLTTASPRRFIARSIVAALRPRRERLRGSPHDPPAGRDAVCAAGATPLNRIQAAIALPAASIATSGADAVCPGAESSSGLDHAPSDERRAASIRRYEPSNHCQAATAPPLSSIATVGA